MRFSEKVHYARMKLGYSQERLAQELHVSFATINRWENGKTEPRKMAIILFSKFCEDNNVNFSSLEEDETYGTNK